jgi:hypothetical protein
MPVYQFQHVPVRGNPRPEHIRQINLPNDRICGIRASADVAELADARDLKSRGLWSCGFESHRRHQSRTSHPQVAVRSCTGKKEVIDGSRVLRRELRKLQLLGRRRQLRESRFGLFSASHGVPEWRRGPPDGLVRSLGPGTTPEFLMYTAKSDQLLLTKKRQRW